MPPCAVQRKEDAMLHGRNARYYRQMVSKVTIDELSEYMERDIIVKIEDENGNPPYDTVLQYYKYINEIKKYKGGAEEVKEPVLVKETPPAKLKRSRKKAPTDI
jgi:hypothetical protein